LLSTNRVNGLTPIITVLNRNIMRKLLPKLNLACSIDEQRPTMCHVYVDNDKVVATNASILVVHSKNDLFGAVSESIPAQCYIPSEDWKELTSKFERLEFVESKENDTLGFLMVYRKKGAPRAVRLLSIESVGYYPNYKAVMPESSNDELSEVGISPELLLDVKQAMTTDKDLNIFLDFTGYARAIRVELNYSSGEVNDYKVEAIIMPVVRVK